MNMKVMVCGVDCKPDTAQCNGYCKGESDSPPQATEAQRIAWAKEKAHKALNAAETAWYEYAGLEDVGPDRERAFQVYENVRCARRL